jgi:hypothetical protein
MQDPHEIDFALILGYFNRYKIGIVSDCRSIFEGNPDAIYKKSEAGALHPGLYPSSSHTSAIFHGVDKNIIFCRSNTVLLLYRLFSP